MKLQRKFFLKAAGIVFLLWLLPTAVSAENPAAEEYRKFLGSDNFYLEYKDPKATHHLAAVNGSRLARASYNDEEWAISLNILGLLFAGGGDKYPDAMYAKGNYYQFIDEGEAATMLPESELTEEEIDPRQGWSTIRQKLAVPLEFTALCPADSFRSQVQSLREPQFAGTSEKSLGGKNCSCDRYVAEVQAGDSGALAQLAFDYFYEGDELIRVESRLLQQGKEYLINAYEVKTIAAALPKGIFKIGKNTKVYSAGHGDMDDLLERRVQIGTLEGLP